MRMVSLLALVPLVSGTTLLSAQSASQEFEVASVKLATAGAGGVEGGCHGIDSTFGPSEKAPPPLGRCVITNARLGHLINIAFELNSMQLIKSGPDWIARGVERYNVEAKTEDPTKTTEKQLLQMLRALLVERFQMKFHRETVEGPGFAMVVGKNGPKFKESAAEEEKIVFGGEFPSKPVPGRPVSLTARKYTMAMLANLLSQIAGHGTILDKTGLTGAYDLKLSWDEENGPAFTTAVPEQLGLRLEAQKVPVSMLVVDSAQKPGEN